MPAKALPAGVTSQDVARRVGVSQSAVSLVFGGKAAGRVAPQTQTAILHAARELGYHPNRAAQALKLGRSGLIVLAVPDVSNPYFAAVLQGAEHAARQRGYAVMLASVRDDHDWHHVVLEALSSRSIDGLLCFAMHPPQEEAFRSLLGKAFIVDAPSPVFPTLTLEVEAGMQVAVQHLLGLGHTRIAHLGAAVNAETFHLRHTAYLAALQGAGQPPLASYQEHASFRLTDAFQAAHRLLDQPEPPTAIVCDSDVLAVGVYKAATDLQYRIPHDVSVVSFDDSLLARVLEPELTSIAIPTQTIGEQGIHLLLDLLGTGTPPTSQLVPLALVVRASTDHPSDLPPRNLPHV